jgi:hypothetical protein
VIVKNAAKIAWQSSPDVSSLAMLSAAEILMTMAPTVDSLEVAQESAAMITGV